MDIPCLGVVEIGWQYVVGALTVWIVTQVVIAVATAWLTLQLLKRQTGDLVKGFEALSSTVKSQQAQIYQLALDRQKCRTEAAERFATKAEFVQLMRSSNESDRRVVGKLDDMRGDVSEKIGGVHKRVDDIAKDFHRFQGEIKGKG